MTATKIPWSGLPASSPSPVLYLPEEPWVLLHPREKVRIIPHDQLRVELPPLDPLDVLPLGVREADETAHQGRDRLSEAPAFGALVQR